jgi:hypothetical protein
MPSPFIELSIPGQYEFNFQHNYTKLSYECDVPIQYEFSNTFNSTNSVIHPYWENFGFQKPHAVFLIKPPTEELHTMRHFLSYALRHC